MTLSTILPKEKWAWAVASTTTFALFVFFLLRVQFERKKNMPPGPPRSIFGDNRHQVSPTKPWKTFAEWGKKYGPVISFYLGRTPVIVLGTAKVAWDLLEKRGEIYSSRPRFIIGGEILSGGMRGLGMPYGERWRKWRKLIHAGLNGRIAVNHRPLQSFEAKILMKDLLEDAPKWHTHMERFITSINVSITYGRRITALDDPIVSKNRTIQTYFGKVHMPGKYLVESWPILLKLPRALQWFRWEPERHRAHDTELYLAMLRDVKTKLASGAANPSLATYALDPSSKNELNEVQTAYALSAPFSAGVDTSIAALKFAILAMLNYPQLVEKAQEELDAKVGHDRMPDFSDANDLPYVQAFIKETMRWRPVGPAGVPHSTLVDDTYKGLFIPKGSTVYGNIYAMTKDPTMFPEPEVVRPERFLETDNPRLINFDLVFGFGRRICPGMHIASQSVFIVISRILWAFNVVPEADKQGLRTPPHPDNFSGGLVVSPEPFGCEFIPRNARIKDIIIRDASDAEVQLRSWN